MIPEAEVGRAATDPDGMCPVCRSGEAIRQTSCTLRVEAWACDRCDSRWAMSVVNPGVITLAPDRVQDAQGDDCQPRSYVIGHCGHRRTLWPCGYVDRCECDHDAT